MNAKITVLFLIALVCALMHASSAQSSSVPERCKLPIQAGLCEAYMPRYAYDESKGKCLQFIYGGCQANENNFLTKEDCERVCIHGNAE